MEIIGTVEILRDRVYPDANGGDVYVVRGIYPVITDEGLTFWRMEGKRSTHQKGPEFVCVEAGSGLFAVYPPGDYVTDEIINVDSRKFTESEFQEFLLTDPACLEGPEKRLEFTLSLSLYFT